MWRAWWLGCQWAMSVVERACRERRMARAGKNEEEKCAKQTSRGKTKTNIETWLTRSQSRACFSAQTNALTLKLIPTLT